FKEEYEENPYRIKHRKYRDVDRPDPYCTSAPDRYANAVKNPKRSLKFYTGLDLLETFAPTIFEHPSFNRAPTAILRAHFNRWARTAIHQE
ncbi:uncharacterized protein N7473_008486, partial [Penicillium subrubescens]|uniref:uncharacterized protein n=1 Tax=Penicillium subrubescens TaxID=1316194 RepID=UPI002544FE8C